MPTGEPSRTAIVAAIARGQHRFVDEPPWILDDPFALTLVGPAWPAILNEGAIPNEFASQVRALSVGRNRYAEDRISTSPFEQYVIVGAGLDSFAWRRPDLLRTMSVIEVDHPATQSWKQERATSLGLPVLANHLYAPVDLEAQSLLKGLDAVAFDRKKKSLFSCLGAVQYLSIEAIQAMLRTVSTSRAGSEMVLTYAPKSDVLDESTQRAFDKQKSRSRDSGEPWLTLLLPDEAEALVESCGFEVIEHLSPDAFSERYFSGRTDDLRSPNTVRFLTARVKTRQ